MSLNYVKILVPLKSYLTLFTSSMLFLVNRVKNQHLQKIVTTGCYSIGTCNGLSMKYANIYMMLTQHFNDRLINENLIRKVTREIDANSCSK